MDWPEAFLWALCATLAFCAALLTFACVRLKRRNASLLGELHEAGRAAEQARQNPMGASLTWNRPEDRERISRLLAVGQMAGGIAHDVNNHLATVKTSLEVLLSSEDEHTKKKCVSYMQSAIANASAMLRRIVEFSRGGGAENEATPMDGMLSVAVDLLKSAAGSRAAVEYEAGPAGGTVMGNYYEIQNAVLNIGLNALDALPERGGRVAIKAWVADENPLKPEPRAKWYCVSVRDNGCGMAKEVQNRIFEAFYTTKPAGRGSGLGLSTARDCVTRCGGTISVWSEPGAGSEFVLMFPLMDAPSITAGAAQAVPPSPEASSHAFPFPPI